MFSTDNPEVTINHINPKKIPEMHPAMIEVLNAHSVQARMDKSSGEWIVQGIDNSLQSMKSKGKRKSRSFVEDIKPPGRITGVTKKAPFDVVQALPLTDKDHPNSPKMRWLFYWMLVCFPKERIMEDSMNTLLELYYFEEPEAIPIMKGIFLSFMSRIEDIQLLVSCGQFPPYSFVAVSHFELVTVSLGRILDTQEVNEETETTKQRREYVSGFCPLTVKYITGSIDSNTYVSAVCSMVERGGVHALFETIVKEQTELSETTHQIEKAVDVSTFNPFDGLPFGFNPDDFASLPDGPEEMTQDVP